MKTVKLSSIPQESDVSNLINLIGFNSGGVVKTKHPISDFYAENTLDDANIIHKMVNRIIVMRITSKETLNIPTLSNGLLVHFQRGLKGNEGSYQAIIQIYTDGAGVYIRAGDGAIFGEWAKIY